MAYRSAADQARRRPRALPPRCSATTPRHRRADRGALPGAGPAQPDGWNGGRLRQKHEFLDGGADDVTLATLGEVLLEPTLTTLGNFLARSNNQSSVALASFTVGGFQLEGYAMTLSAFALTPGRRYSFGCRYRLGTASNLVMYVSAADNDYVGVTGTFLGTPSQASGARRAWTSRCRRAESPSCTLEPSEARSPGWPYSMQIRASAFESLPLTGSTVVDHDKLALVRAVGGRLLLKICSLLQPGRDCPRSRSVGHDERVGGKERGDRAQTCGRERCAGNGARGVHARREHVRAVHVVAQQLVAAHIALRGEPVQRQTKSLSTQLSLTTNQRNPGCLVIAGNTGNVVCFTDLSDSRVKTEIAEANVAKLRSSSTPWRPSSTSART